MFPSCFDLIVLFLGCIWLFLQTLAPLREKKIGAFL